MYSFETFKVDIVVTYVSTLQIPFAGGSSDGEFIYVKNTFNPLLSKIVYADSSWYSNLLSGFKRQPGRLYKNDIILELQGQSVAGFRQREMRSLIYRTCIDDNVDIVTLTCAAAGTISPSLSDILMQETMHGSANDILKHQIRENVSRVCTVPVTTREPKAGEVDGKDYWFYSPDAFWELVDKDCMLEYWSVGDTLYGVALPPRGSWDRLTSEEWNDFCAIRPILKRNSSFTKSMEGNVTRLKNSSGCRSEQTVDGVRRRLADLTG